MLKPVTPFISNTLTKITKITTRKDTVAWLEGEQRGQRPHQASKKVFVGKFV